MLIEAQHRGLVPLAAESGEQEICSFAGLSWTLVRVQRGVRVSRRHVHLAMFAAGNAVSRSSPLADERSLDDTPQERGDVP